MHIEEALCKMNNRVIKAKDLSRGLYFSKYKGYLYCKEEECTAKLNFVDGNNRVKFFRTNPSTNHKIGCPSEVNHDENAGETKKKSYENRLNINNKHMNDTLERAFKKFISGSASNGGVFNKKPKYINSIKIKGDNVGGNPELFNDGLDIIGRGPNISTRFFSNLEKNDEGQIRCVIGYVNSMQLMQRHGYINLTPKGQNSVKVHFAEYFVVNNESEFNNMKIIDEYINLMNSIKEPIICCCIGRIKYVKIGINILIDRYQGFALNGMGFRRILAYMNEYKERGELT
ncbi:hypothetical protein [Clostridium estertheticum]|uniref:hypothetical protein n=1 Tax=Clostridium estertheticum TaxID=238834 RepID=UPI001CF5D352|nr:hypothetical protein [Clostridium estertheticum]MCB2356895.1 hypothetical protein [Clostridium estertheticum]WAG44014.1 hypothetical protein LL065_25930 [Clostridium estertheticum]